jgi:hypothetical protein
MREIKSANVLLRIQPSLLDAIKREAARRHITYSSLMRRAMAREIGLTDYNDKRAPNGQRHSNGR